MCLNPIPFVREKNGIRILRNIDAVRLQTLEGIDGFLSCGKCVECQMNYSNSWSLRCVQEMKYHKIACFVTLTYNEKNLPQYGVDKKEIQRFIKRIRKDNNKLRYFACGEYGSKGLRPHYHLIFFGFVPPDLVPLWKDEKGNQLYTSDYMVEKWHLKGFVSIGLSYDIASIKYCCKYLQKTLDSQVRKIGLNPSFILMSRNPMLGLREKDIDIDSPFEYYNGKTYYKPSAYNRKIPPFMKPKVNVQHTSLTVLANKKKKTANFLPKGID